MAVSISNLTKGNNNNVSASSFNTASVTPGSNHLILLHVTARRGDSTNPTAPSVSGNGLTWVKITEKQFDTAGTSRKTIFLFRAMGASPSTGAITIDFGAQTITNCNWIVDDASGVDISGINGSGAIVQSAVASNETGSASSLTVTLAAFSNTNNATYGVFANDTGNNTWAAGSGFSIIGNSPDATSSDCISEFKNTNDTTVDATFTNVAGVTVGGIAIEIRSAGSISIVNVIHSNASGSITSQNTASVTPSANKLQLLTVNSRTNITTNPNQPTVTGNSLTWVAINTIVWDSSSASRKRLTVFRAMGSSPSSGAITIDFGGQTQTDVTWSLEEVTGMDTSGTNGSGAIVQSATNSDETGTATSLTVTLAAFSSTNNATYGSLVSDGGFTYTPGSGFTAISDQTGGWDQAVISRPDNDTTVDVTWDGAGSEGGLALELKAATATATTNQFFPFFPF